jgi:hypothetical protein
MTFRQPGHSRYGFGKLSYPRWRQETKRVRVGKVMIGRIRIQRDLQKSTRADTAEIAAALGANNRLACWGSSYPFVQNIGHWE